jgi:hypothetical protein
MKSSLPIIALCFTILNSNAFADHREGVATGGGGGDDSIPTLRYDGIVGHALLKCPNQLEKAIQISEYELVQLTDEKLNELCQIQFP